MRLSWVKANAGAAGIDKQILADYEDNLYALWNRLFSGNYFTPSVKTAAILKKTGFLLSKRVALLNFEPMF